MARCRGRGRWTEHFGKHGIDNDDDCASVSGTWYGCVLVYANRMFLRAKRVALRAKNVCF